MSLGIGDPFSPLERGALMHYVRGWTDLFCPRLVYCYSDGGGIFEQSKDKERSACL